MQLQDFYKFAKSEKNISSLTISDYEKVYDLIDPYILEERKLNAVPMSVFSRLLSERIIWLGTEIDDDVANIVQAQLLYLSSVKNNEDISMYINSPGGIVYSGFGIIDTMEYIQPNIRTLCTGMAASMAAVILACGEKGKRSALRHSRIMIHQVMGGASGQASDVMIAAKEIERVKKELNEILVDKTGQPYEKIENDTDRDFWMTSNDAVNYGIIDEVLFPKK